MSNESDALRERILGAIKQVPSPTRGQVRLRALLALCVACLAVLVFLLVFGRNSVKPSELAVGQSPVSWPLLVTTSLGALVIASSVAWFVVGGGAMFGRPRWHAAVVVAAVPLALFMWKLVWSDAAGATEWWPSRPGFRCLRVSLVVGLVPLISFLAVRRRSDPLHPALTGAIVGVAAGAFSWLYLDIWCPVASPLHLLIGHVLPLALLAAAGAVVGSRLLAIRADMSSINSPP